MSKNDLNIHGIFPVPIAVAETGNEFDNEHQKLIRDTEYIINPYSSNGNRFDYDTSNSTHVLDTEDVPNIRNFILSHVNEYSKVLFGNTDELVFTQSWIMRHPEHQHMFTHRHTNSAISGSYYLQCTEEDANLNLHKDTKEGQIGLPVIRPTTIDSMINDFNCDVTTVPAITGKLILFPSWLQHSMGSGEMDPGRELTGTPDPSKYRYVLAFNTWWNHPIGVERNLNRL